MNFELQKIFLNVKRQRATLYPSPPLSSLVTFPEVLSITWTEMNASKTYETMISYRAAFRAFCLL